MIEIEQAPFEDKEVGLVYKVGQREKLIHAIQHDREDEAIIEALNDPEDTFEKSLDLRGTRKIIFSLMLDLGMI